MRLTGSRAYIRPTPVPKMPPGLVELMEDLTRDVLKNNPSDVYEFCAAHMRKLLEIRDGTTFKPPLTIEQKVARAQEKVRKRSEVRWQKHLEGNASLSKDPADELKTDIEEINAKPLSPAIESVLKPPVYHDLNIENASEIEISHEPGDIPDLVNDNDSNKITDNHKLDTNGLTLNTKINDNTEINAEVQDKDKSYQRENNFATDNIKEESPNVGEINQIISVSVNENNDASAAIKTIEEDIANVSPDCKIEIKNDDCISPQITGLINKNEIIHDLDDKQVDVKGTKIDTPLPDLGTIVNTAIGVRNVYDEISRSPSRNAENTVCEDDAKGAGTNNINDEKYGSLIKDSVKPIFSSEIFVSSKDTKLNAGELIAVDNKKYNNPKDSVCLDIQEDTIDNSKELSVSMVAPNEENYKIVKTSKLDIVPTGEENSISFKNILEPPVIHINDVLNGNPGNKDTPDLIVSEKPDPINITEISKKLQEVNNTGNIKPDDTSITKESSQILQGEEPSVNVLDIYESENVHEPNEGSVIEIRISQVAEALNNEVPLSAKDNSVKVLDISELPVNAFTDNELNNPYFLDDRHAARSEQSELPLLNSALINAQVENEVTDLYADKEKEGQQFSKTVDSDETLSISTSIGNNDDIRNAETSNATNPISIDKTDGLDNTSLIESGTSEETDKLTQQNQNSNSMDLETAAVTIQKVFRSFLFKSRASTFDDNDVNISLDEENEKKDELVFQASSANKERRGISRMDTVLQTVNEEKSLSLSTDDSSTLSSAATTIQAHVRGFLVRNKLHSHKTTSSSSLVISDGLASLDGDIENMNKTILNIHIVPEGGNYLSRDESMLTSMDLSLDGSPPSSLNLHPLGYDKNERRKQLKREDAIQSISPPSNNSGKLSEDVDSIKEMLITEGELQTDQKSLNDDESKKDTNYNRPGSGDTSPTKSLTIETVIEAHKLVDQESTDAETATPVTDSKKILTKQSSDEMDVVTPFEDKNSLTDSCSTSKLMHSSEFHDIVLPTKVSRSEAAVVSEFKNVLVYFLLWNNS